MTLKLLTSIAIVLKQLREERSLTQEDVYNDTSIHVGRIETANVNLVLAPCPHYAFIIISVWLIFFNDRKRIVMYSESSFYS